MPNKVPNTGRSVCGMKAVEGEPCNNCKEGTIKYLPTNRLDVEHLMCDNCYSTFGIYQKKESEHGV